VLCSHSAVRSVLGPAASTSPTLSMAMRGQPSSSTVSNRKVSPTPPARSCPSNNGSRLAGRRGPRDVGTLGSQNLLGWQGERQPGLIGREARHLAAGGEAQP